MLGAITGDIVGSRFEFNNHKSIEFELFHRDCSYTDDSICSAAVADWLIQKEGKQIGFGSMLQKWCLKFPDPMGGYGNRFYSWIGEKNPKPYNSYGNGSAMRIAPVGWAYETVEETTLIAAKIASVSHNHPEGIKGAQAVATAIFMARKGHSKGEIREKIEHEYRYDLSRTCEEIRPVYKYNETCQQTVPEAIIAFLDSTGFEDAIRLAVSLGGDSDTLTCITGGIAEAFYGIPYEIEEKAESFLPEEIRNVVAGFKEKYALK
ncbi:MAG: ADP-ribosylglycohydrolase family protein [Mariniphaga sp.]